MSGHKYYIVTHRSHNICETGVHAHLLSIGNVSVNVVEVDKLPEKQ